MKPSAKTITTAIADARGRCRSGCGTSTTSSSSTKTTNHGSCRGPSSRLPSSIGSTSAVERDARRAAPDAGREHDGERPPARRAVRRPAAATRRPASASDRRPRRAGRARSRSVLMVLGPRRAGLRHCTARERNRGLTSRTPEDVAPGEHLGAHRASRRPGTAGRCAGRRRPRPPWSSTRGGAAHRLGRVLGAHGVDPAGHARPRPSARRGRPTSRCHWPTRRVLPGTQRVDAGAGRAPRRGRRCRPRPAPPGPSAGRRSGAGCAWIRSPRPRRGRRRARSGSGPEPRDDLVAPLGPTSSHCVAPRRSAYAVPSVRRRRGAAAPGRPAPGPPRRRCARRRCR